MLKGDGYDKREKANPRGSKFVSPYTKYESFAGLNISRALKVGMGSYWFVSPFTSLFVDFFVSDEIVHCPKYQSVKADTVSSNKHNAITL